MGCGSSTAHVDEPFLGSHKSKALDDPWRAALLAGTLDEATLERLLRPPAMTLYVSSDRDAGPERDHLRAKVWPRLHQLCDQQRLLLEIVDLHSGGDDAVEGGAPELCLSEVARCCARSADGAAAFLLLSTERYGRRALPRRVPAAELTTLMAHLPETADPSARAMIDTW